MRVVGVHRDDRRPTLAEHCAESLTDLYVPEFEHDACGVAMVADLKGRRDHGIVRRALTALLRLEHRGARGAEVNTGDGAGILLQIPDAFYRAVVAVRPARRRRLRGGPRLPAHRRHRRGHGRDRRDSRPRRACACSAGASCRSTPTAPTSAQPRAASCPRSASCSSRARRARRGIELERRTFCLRKRAEHATAPTSPRCRRAPSSTRACCPSRRSRRSTRTSPTSAWSARWRSCTPGSPPTRSPRGRSRTPTATSRTTARSTRCAATATGWPRARRCWRAS